MSDNHNEERENDLSERTDDAAHPFDQTNGLAEGLEGDADTPEQADKTTGEGDGIGFLAAPAPGTQMAGGVIPAVAAKDPHAADADTDTDDPSAP